MRLYEEPKQSTTVVKSGISVPVLLTSLGGGYYLHFGLVLVSLY